MNSILFSDLKNGTEFWYDGCIWVKVDQSTAMSYTMIKPMEPETWVSKINVTK